MLLVADPTIILVHGAFADASSWSRLYAGLAGDGLRIKAPPNPLRGVTAEDAEYTRCVIEQVEGPVLLVGHSYGGSRHHRVRGGGQRGRGGVRRGNGAR
jgi:pimeloyl-ACP methyl ester carboxylesterase